MKPKRNYKPGPMDNCQTPPYALAPLLPYLVDFSPAKKIWDPAAGWGLLVNAFSIAGFLTTGSDLANGDDFLRIDQPMMDVIVTNPPYSKKPQFFKRCYELGHPFALLVPVETLGIESCASQFREHGCEIMFLTPRVNFKMPNEGWFSSAQFPVCWVCHDILPVNILFVQIHPPKRTVSRQVWKKDKKTGRMNLVTEWGYDPVIERPSGFDWEKEEFVYATTGL